MSKLGLIAAAIQAIIAALVLLDLFSLSDEQLAGIMVAVNAILAALFAWFDPSIPVGPQGESG